MIRRCAKHQPNANSYSNASSADKFDEWTTFGIESAEGGGVYPAFAIKSENWEVIQRQLARDNGPAYGISPAGVFPLTAQGLIARQNLGEYFEHRAQAVMNDIVTPTWEQMLALYSQHLRDRAERIARRNPSPPPEPEIQGTNPGGVIFTEN
jgi:hypothetical protein